MARTAEPTPAPGVPMDEDWSYEWIPLQCIWLFDCTCFAELLAVSKYGRRLLAIGVRSESFELDLQQDRPV